jgi:hypothetical protein
MNESILYKYRHGGWSKNEDEGSIVVPEEGRNWGFGFDTFRPKI